MFSSKHHIRYTQALPPQSVVDALRVERDKLMLPSARRHFAVGMATGAVFMFATCGLLLQAGIDAWRIAIIAGSFLIMAAFQGAYVFRLSVGGKNVDDSIICIALAGMFHSTVATALTGGLASPLIIHFVMAALMPALLLGPHRLSAVLLVIHVAMILATALLPISVTGNGVSHGYHVAITAIFCIWVVIMVNKAVFRISGAWYHSYCSFAAMRESNVVLANEQLQRLQSVGSRVAHELKNPLAAIKGLVQLIARAPETEKHRERFDVVIGEIARMEIILREYLSFTRPLEDLKKEALDLAASANEVADVLAGRMENSQIELVSQLSPVSVDGDPRRIKEAIMNVLANAVDATPRGGKITLSTSSDAEYGNVIIRDSGNGISAADLERLGRSFFTTRVSGTGLGVVLAHNVVAQHGGELAYLSQVGAGTQVTIKIPRAAREPATASVLKTAVGAASA